MDAAAAWADALSRWSIPDHILAAAPESPWGFPARLFAPAADATPTPSRAAAIAALPDGGSVLDVGCGAGAGGYALVPPAALLIGADESASMLEAFAAEGDSRGVEHHEVLGRWPDVSDKVAAVDVVVCHHVLYNVADLPAFLRALTVTARHRVVVEMTDVHPQAALAPLWRTFWNLERPDGPTASDAAAVARDAGLDPVCEPWSRPPRWRSLDVDRSEYVAWVRRRLCLPAERDAEVAAALGPVAQSSGMVTMWWKGQATGSSSGRAR